MKLTHLALIAAAAAVTAGSALADDPMANTYANTVVTTDSKTGAAAKLWFNQDNTFKEEVVGKDGKPVDFTGTWTLKDDGKTICLTANPPPGGQAMAPSCSPLEKHAVGDKWTVTNNQNQTFDVTLNAGR